MRAAIYLGSGCIEVEDRSKPRLKNNEILVRVWGCSICGSDVRIYRRGSSRVKAPLVLGHEFSGDIVEVGGDVRDLDLGMRVVAYPAIPCLRCYQCIRGRYNLCENLGGIGYDHDGAFAEYVKIPEGILRVGGVIRIPDSISYREATLIEPLACCVNGVMMSRMEVDDSVVILGDGPMGLLHLQLVKALGASKVVLVGRTERRLKIALELGADSVVDSSKEDATAKVGELTDGKGANLVIIAVGASEAIEQAFMMVRAGGKINIFGGVPPDTRISLDPNIIHYSELTVIGSFSSTPAYMRKAAELISSRRVVVDRLITHTFQLQNISDAFEVAERLEGLRIMVTPH